MLDSEFKKIIDNARDVLVGKVPDPKAQIEQITTAMIYKFMDYMDRENIALGLEPQFFVDDYKGYSWSQILDAKLSGQARLDLYVQAINKLPHSPHLPPLFRNIFKDTFLPFRDSRTFNLFLKEIDKFDYQNSENLGNAFEYLLSILGSQGDAGQFRTPRHIIDFIVSAVDPQKEDTILDPACGTAGFLISAYKHIIKTNSKNYNSQGDSTIIAGKSAYDTVLDSTENYIGEMLTPYQKGQLLSNVTGYDISPDMVKLSLVNLYLHGFKQPKIFEYDTLSDDKRWDDDFDVILANPPFMSPKGGITPHKRFSIQANRAEVLFVDYIAEHLKISGRAGIIVPEGIIFQASNAYKNLRKNLIENWGLYAVVSLPSGVFQPYSGVKTSILFLDKNLAKQSPDILFIKITNDGFDLGAQRRKIDMNDLPDALQIIKEWKQTRNLLDDKMAMTVAKSKIAEDGDYNLTAERYKEAIDYSNAKWDMVELGDVCTLVRGITYTKNDEIKENGFKVLRANNIDLDGFLNLDNIKHLSKSINLNDTKKLKKNDIFICLASGSKSHIGKVAFISNDIEYYFGGFMGVVRINKNIDVIPKYMFLQLHCDRFNDYLTKVISGVNISNISSKILNQYKIPLPPLEVQEDIVAEIEQYQKVIDGAKQVVESYKPQIEIDPEWEKVKLGDVFKPEYGYTDKALEHGSYRFVRITDISEDGDLKQDNKKFINDFEGASKYLLRKGDLLLARTGATFGKTLLWTDDQDAVFASFLIRLNPINNKIFPMYYWIFTRTTNYWDQANNLVTGGGQPQFNGNAVKKIIIPLPPLSVQQEIVSRIEEEQKYVDGCKKLIEIYEEKIKKRIEKVWGE